MYVYMCVQVYLHITDIVSLMIPRSSAMAPLHERWDPLEWPRNLQTPG